MSASLRGEWPILPIKRVTSIKLGKMVQPQPSSEDDVEAPYLRAAHVQPDGRVIDVDDKTMWFRPDELAELDLCAGDVVVVEGGAGYGRSAVLRADRPGWGFQNSINRVRPKSRRADGRYIDYVLQRSLVSGETELFVNTATIPHFTAEKVAEIRSLFPAVEEQRAIADFLDRETAQINAMVDAQERLVVLLEERRNAVVLDAVTTGIDRGAESTDRTPSHWERLPIKALGRTQSGAGFPEDQQGFADLPIPFYKVNALGRASADGVIRDRYDTIDAETAVRLRAAVIPAGSVVMAKIGAALLLSRFRLLAYDSCIDNNMLAFLPNERVLGRYAMYAFEQMNLSQLVNPGAVPSLSDRVLRDFRLAWPGVSEQAEIVDYLDSATSRIDIMITKAQESIALMKERRAALISAAVTGRIDVRTGIEQVERDLEEAHA